MIDLNEARRMPLYESVYRQLREEIWEEEQRFENPDGTSIIFDRDYSGKQKEAMDQMLRMMEENGNA